MYQVAEYLPSVKAPLYTSGAVKCLVNWTLVPT